MSHPLRQVRNSGFAPPRVAVHTLVPRESACAAIRLEKPLEAAGWQAQWFTRGRSTSDAPPEADVHIIQRHFPGPDTEAFISHLVRTGRPLVYELDDPLTDMPPRHPDRQLMLRRKHMIWMLRLADLITVSTPELARVVRRYSRRPVRVLPNAVDPTLFGRPPRERAGPCRLLLAGTATHQDDWAIVHEPLLALLRRYEGRLSVTFFGDIPERFRQHEGVRALGYLPSYAEYARALRDLEVDIALVPLEDTAFNRAKSDIKWLEYSAAGLPALFSRVPAYAGSVTHEKTGLLVENRAEAWLAAIQRAVEEPGLCAAMTQAARREVLAHRGIETLSAGLIEALQSLHGDFHRSAPLAGRGLWPAGLRRRAQQQWRRQISWRFKQRDRRAGLGHPDRDE